MIIFLSKLRLKKTVVSLRNPPVVIGSANFDIIGRPKDQLLMATSNLGSFTAAWGGVGRNIAECIGRLGGNPILISSVGTDMKGQTFFPHATSVGIQTQCVLTSSLPTATYLAILDEHGDLFTTICDTQACEALSPAVLTKYKSVIIEAPLVVLDGNVPSRSIEYVANLCAEHETPVWFEPTSVAKSIRAQQAWCKGQIHFVSPSELELVAMARGLGFSGTVATTISNTQIRALCHYLFIMVLGATKPVHIVVKRGAEGVMVATLNSRISSNGQWVSGGYPNGVSFMGMPAVPAQVVRSTNGAGDTLVGATVWTLCRLNERPDTKSQFAGTRLDLQKAILHGICAATSSVESEYAVSPQISPKNLRGAYLRRKSMIVSSL